MSAGDGHRRPNTCSPKKKHHLLATGGAPQLMRRWRGLEDGYDIPDVAGSCYAAFFVQGKLILVRSTLRR